MKANELRIGSKVRIKGDEVEWHYCQVTAISSYSAWVETISNGEPDLSTLQDVEYSNLHPIPLTPEILERCVGFVKKTGSIFSNFTYSYEFSHIDVLFKRDKVIIYYLTGGVKTEMPHIKHLHTFQNFIFALTGTELQINLNENNE